jgi:hypothetical protein
VGLVWIDLTAPSYGIHGTPEPKNIGKTQSHGCIRMTNWDALDLAGMVGRGSIGKRRRVLARQYHCIIATMAVTTTGMDRTVAIDYRWADIPNPVSFSFCNFHFHSCRSRCFHDFFARFSRDESLHQLLRNSSGSLAMFAAIRRHHREALLPPEPESTTAKHPSRFSCRMQYHCLRAGQLYGAADGK